MHARAVKRTAPTCGDGDRRTAGPLEACRLKTGAAVYARQRASAGAAQGRHGCGQLQLVTPPRSQMQLEFGFEQTIATDDWPEMDQTVGRGADGWE